MARSFVFGSTAKPLRFRRLSCLGGRADGQQVLLAIKNMRSESAGAWRTLLAMWDGVPVQRCTVHNHKDPLAHAPERLHEEIAADYNDMVYAETSQQIEARRGTFIRKWRTKHRAVADSLEEAGARLFSVTHLPPEQWKSPRTTNAIERLHEDFKRRIKRIPHCVLLPARLQCCSGPC